MSSTGLGFNYSPFKMPKWNWNFCEGMAWVSDFVFVWVCRVCANHLLKRTILFIESLAPKAQYWNMTEFVLVQIMQYQTVQAIKLLIKYNSIEYSHYREEYRSEITSQMLSSQLMLLLFTFNFTYTSSFLTNKPGYINNCRKINTGVLLLTSLLVHLFHNTLNELCDLEL